MSIETPAPRRIEWAAPEGWTVWADEDGCHIRTRSGDSLEQCDVERLFSLWSQARAVTEAGHVPAPKSPTREEARAMNSLHREEWLKRRVIKAVKDELEERG